MINKKIILVGNPNTGKSTLFNRLTDSNEKVSNWHGVTVGIKSKKIKYKNLDYDVVDTPGLYSFSPYSNEEEITLKYLKRNKDNLILNICDANNLKRNLILTLELLKNGFDVVLVINMFQEVHDIDYELLSKLLNVKTVKCNARAENDVLKLVEYIQKHYNQKTQKV